MNFIAAVEFCESQSWRLFSLEENQEIETFINPEMTSSFISSSGKQSNIIRGYYSLISH